MSESNLGYLCEDMANNEDHVHDGEKRNVHMVHDKEDVQILNGNEGMNHNLMDNLLTIDNRFSCIHTLLKDVYYFSYRNPVNQLESNNCHQGCLGHE